MTEQKPIPNKAFEEELEAKKGFWEFFYGWCEEREMKNGTENGTENDS